jgi:hypothetical protein
VVERGVSFYAGLELSACGVNVVDAQRDRVRVDLNLAADGGGLDQLERQAPGLELAARVRPYRAEQRSPSTVT